MTRPAPILELCPLPDLLFLRLHLGVLSLLALPSERCRYVVGFGTLVLVFVWALKMLVPGTSLDSLPGAVAVDVIVVVTLAF